MPKGKVYVGTSGWMYKHWGEVFYPKNIKGKDQLPYFARHFNTVEINNTFYRIPSKSAVEGWRDSTPDAFIFAIKLNNYFTHTKKLILDQKTEDRLQFFAKNIAPLKNKMPVLLVQLQPSFRANLERLDHFLTALPKYLKSKPAICCEFRHESWFSDETYAILRNHHMGLVIGAYPGKFKPPPLTSDVVYIRYHAAAERPRYTNKQLDQWADYISDLAGQVKSIYVYFNNDFEGCAIINARYLQQALNKRGL